MAKCAGKTAKGTKCRKSAKAGSRFCSQHSSQKRVAVSKKKTAVTKKRAAALRSKKATALRGKGRGKKTTYRGRGRGRRPGSTSPSRRSSGSGSYTGSHYKPAAASAAAAKPTVAAVAALQPAVVVQNVQQPAQAFQPQNVVISIPYQPPPTNPMVDVDGIPFDARPKVAAPMGAQRNGLTDSIFFYDKFSPYYVLTNFYENAPFQIGGIRYPSSEHYFQAGKFAVPNDASGQGYVRAILAAPTPHGAFTEAGKHGVSKRAEWNAPGDFKNWVMWEALWAKFRQNQAARTVLMSTKHKKLYEDSPIDSYWGIGPNGQGYNVLGRMLVFIRDSGNL